MRHDGRDARNERQNRDLPGTACVRRMRPAGQEQRARLRHLVPVVPGAAGVPLGVPAVSQKHVEAVFGPQWVQDAWRRSEDRADMAQTIVLSLRRKLRSSDPSLPHEYDGTAWATIEAEWMGS